MILIADSGSTKTAWSLLEPKTKETLVRVQTKGMNPFFQTEDEMVDELTGTLLPQLASSLATQNIREVYFYGAGCTPEKCPQVERALRCALALETGRAEVYSDMVGAARGLCGHQPGIACILGTGSNSCLYDGCRVVDNVSPLGFILGDEGSGAVLGKLFVGALLKNRFTQGLKEEFLAEYQLTPADIIERVYRQPFPNRFLASLSPFINKHLDDAGVHALVKNSFKDFFLRNVMQYEGYATLPIGFIGSIANYYRPVLQEAAGELNLTLGQILQAPMEGLIAYHLS